MIELEKYNNELIDFLVDRTISEVYILKKDNIVIGYGKINVDINNKINIFILPEYRGNGYGNQLFLKMICLINDLSVIYLTFQNDNTIAKRIVEKHGGKQSSLTNGIITYVLPINNIEN